jgi:hypothetical protein
MQVVRHSQTSGSPKADKNYHVLMAATPQPDVETDGMMRFGLGLMGIIAMRRQKNRSSNGRTVVKKASCL